MLINLIKIVDNSGMIKHYIDIQVKDLGKKKNKAFSINDGSRVKANETEFNYIILMYKTLYGF